MCPPPYRETRGYGTRILGLLKGADELGLLKGAGDLAADAGGGTWCD